MAGTWSPGVEYRSGNLNNAYSRPIGVVKSFTADAADHTIPDVTVEDISGLLTGIDVEFDADTPPNSLIVVIKSIGGITLVTGTALTASGRIPVSPPVDICGGYKVSCSDNTTNGAKGSIVCLFR